MPYPFENCGDAAATDSLAGASAAFIKNWPDVIVPIPPSNAARKRKPSSEILWTAA